MHQKNKYLPSRPEQFRKIHYAVDCENQPDGLSQALYVYGQEVSN